MQYFIELSVGLSCAGTFGGDALQSSREPRPGGNSPVVLSALRKIRRLKACATIRSGTGSAAVRSTQQGLLKGQLKFAHRTDCVGEDALKMFDRL
jgi:hypothetical protein